MAASSTVFSTFVTKLVINCTSLPTFRLPRKVFWEEPAFCIYTGTNLKTFELSYGIELKVIEIIKFNQINKIFSTDTTAIPFHARYASTPRHTPPPTCIPITSCAYYEHMYIQYYFNLYLPSCGCCCCCCARRRVHRTAGPIHSVIEIQLMPSHSGSGLNILANQMISISEIKFIYFL